MAAVGRYTQIGGGWWYTVRLISSAAFILRHSCWPLSRIAFLKQFRGRSDSYPNFVAVVDGDLSAEVVLCFPQTITAVAVQAVGGKDLLEERALPRRSAVAKEVSASFTKGLQMARVSLRFVSFHLQSALAVGRPKMELAAQSRPHFFFHVRGVLRCSKPRRCRWK
jgi:hypothetical protein